MIDIASFVLRWMFLSNLCRDISEIQTLPSLNVHPSQLPTIHNHQDYQYSQQQQHQGSFVDNPTTALHHSSDILSSHHPHPMQQAHERQQPPHPFDIANSHQQYQQSQHSTSTGVSHHRSNIKPRDVETEYKENCWKGILIHPPNSVHRNIVINNLRNELVQQLHQKIRHDTHVIHRYRQSTKNYSNVPSVTPTSLPNSDNDSIENDKNTNSFDMTQSETPTLNEYIRAKRSLLQFRNYLPQLVSVVLKSPPPLDVGHAIVHDEMMNNPIHRIRHILLTHCMNDASIGIELCWLLEAEVGRTWKSLFEHRQQTGRRLIVVLPADKAIVLAKIGIEKREAFDLLQDTEQATAFGYTESITGPNYNEFMDANHLNVEHHTRLPSSISRRRCSHFGDTMHFIDRLSKISSDLRIVPTQYRYNVLHENLHELNRRLRRRMVTQGETSLDVDDNLSPYDWPHIEDMSVDMISHSVHLPLIPQTGSWPDGEFHGSDDGNKKNTPGLSEPNTEVVRVLNIVVHESKLLSSRERCPFLIHVEVSDSGLEGNDARLYTSGISDIGSTIGEALGMMNSVESSRLSQPSSVSLEPFTPKNNVPYAIPNELLQEYPEKTSASSGIGVATKVSTNDVTPDEVKYDAFPRGGSQRESPYYYSHDVSSDGYMVDPFDLVRQQEYEQLHHQWYSHQPFESLPPILPPTMPKLSVGSELLDKVFGRTWGEKCKEIRDASPYGHVKGWRLASFIMKAGEDIRRESFVMQIISKLQSWFNDDIPEVDRPFMRPYTIMCVGGDAGLLECLSDAKSVDEVKKRTDSFTSLRDYFERAYGPPRTPAFIHPSVAQHRQETQNQLDPFGRTNDSNKVPGQVSFEVAQDNFLRSLVGYSLVCYILQIKDRHNANILLDRLGHIMHIDFGYVLGDTPKMGKVPIFSERAPFKLSSDFWDVLGGWNINSGGLGVKFCKMFELAFQCASAHADEIAALTEAAVLSLNSNPRNARATANGVRSRLRMRGASGSREQKLFIMDLVNAALTSWGTSTYDWLQRNMNGYQ